MLDYHNFVLSHWLKAAPVDYQQVLDEALAYGEYMKPMVDDVSHHAARSAPRRRQRVLFEGAQGSLLDIDHGTYPYVTSSNTTVGGACAGTGVGARDIDYVLGICKAYATRVGGGPFPTELIDDIGELLRQRGNEFGATTGRPRRCGWIDLVALKRAVQINGIDGLAITKLDVLDGLPTHQGLHRLRIPRQAPRTGAARRGRLGRMQAGVPGVPGLGGADLRRAPSGTGCRRRRAPICARSRSWPSARWHWSRPVPTATTPSCCAIRSPESAAAPP